MDKYLETLGKYDVNLNDEEIKAEVEQIVAENFEANNNVDAEVQLGLYRPDHAQSDRQ